MAESAAATGKAFNVGVGGDAELVPAEQAREIEAAQRAVDKAEQQLERAEAALAELKKGSK